MFPYKDPQMVNEKASILLFASRPIVISQDLFDVNLGEGSKTVR